MIILQQYHDCVHNTPNNQEILYIHASIQNILNTYVQLCMQLKEMHAKIIIYDKVNNLDTFGALHIARNKVSNQLKDCMIQQLWPLYQAYPELLAQHTRQYHCDARDMICQALNACPCDNHRIKMSL